MFRPPTYHDVRETWFGGENTNFQYIVIVITYREAHKLLLLLFSGFLDCIDLILAHPNNIKLNKSKMVAKMAAKTLKLSYFFQKGFVGLFNDYIVLFYS